MKLRPRFLCPLLAAAVLCLLFLLLFPFFFRKPSLDANEAFETFTKEFFLENVTSDTLTLHYALADPAAAGVPRANTAFCNYAKNSASNSAAALENTLSSLEAFDPQKLSADNRLTLDILKTQLSLELALEDFPYYEEIFSPTLGIQAQLPLLLAEYAFYSRQDVEDYLSLLEQMDSYFESLLLYEQEKSAAGLFMSDENASEVLSQCRDFIAVPEGHFLLVSFEKRLETIEGLTEAEKAAYIKQNQELFYEHVIPAYELLIQGLTALLGTGTNDYGLYYYPKGAEYYEALVACTVGSSRDIAGIKALLQAQMLSDVEQMASLVAESPELLTEYSRSIPAVTPKEALESLAIQIQTDFPEIPNVTYTVKYVDNSLADYCSPAFYLTPPMDRMEEHVIYINPAANYDDLSLFTTLAHEGYPGHLYQTVYENSRKRNPVLSLFSFGGYVEGWATYVERYAYSLTGLKPEMAELLAANSYLILGLYAVSDIGIHYDGWLPEDLAEYFGSFGITDKNVLQEIYQAIVQDPGNYLKYYLGAAEILALKQEAQERLGEQFSAKDFHTFLLNIGPAPFSVIEEYMKTLL